MKGQGIGLLFFLMVMRISNLLQLVYGKGSIPDVNKSALFALQVHLTV